MSISCKRLLLFPTGLNSSPSLDLCHDNHRYLRIYERFPIVGNDLGKVTEIFVPARIVINHIIYKNDCEFL